METTVPSPAEIRRQARKPTATYAIIAINVAVAIYMQTLSARANEHFLANWALIPARFTSTVLDPFGAVITSPRMATLVTSMFLHGGLTHIALNMFLLFGIGRTVELAIGTPRFLLLYFAAGFGSSIAILLLYHGSLSPFIGASGAVYGVLSGYFLLLPPGPNRTKTLLWTLALIVVPAFIPARIVVGITGSDFLANIAHWGHVGGFGIGLLTMYLMMLSARRKHRLMTVMPEPVADVVTAPPEPPYV